MKTCIADIMDSFKLGLEVIVIMKVIGHDVTIEVEFNHHFKKNSARIFSLPDPVKETS